jgi:hypothetical protein
MDGKREPLPERTVRPLRRLLERKRSAEAGQQQAGDELALAIARLRQGEDPPSVRQLAEALAVSASAIQHWTRRGRRLLNG